MATASPPIMAIAIGPQNTFRLSGTKARMAASAVNTTGRARPVVLTALAAILAFIPLSLNVFWGPMAIAMIGGLAVATGLTLVFLPALYALCYRVKLPHPEAAPPSLAVAQRAG